MLKLCLEKFYKKEITIQSAFSTTFDQTCFDSRILLQILNSGTSEGTHLSFSLRFHLTIRQIQYIFQCELLFVEHIFLEKALKSQATKSFAIIIDRRFVFSPFGLHERIVKNVALSSITSFFLSFFLSLFTLLLFFHRRCNAVKISLQFFFLVKVQGTGREN